jgi:hypothetical protein
VLREWANDCDGTLKVYQRAGYKTPKARPMGGAVAQAQAVHPSEPEPERSNPPSVYYENCTAVRNAGKAPIRRSDRRGGLPASAARLGVSS